jgi:hypothetical protein
VCGFAGGEGCGVHAAACAQVVSRQVDATDRLFERRLPAVPARDRERDAFRRIALTKARHRELLPGSADQGPQIF